MLAATGLTKRLGGRSVLEDVDLSVDAGDIAVLMGPNGAGKTVLLCCLAGGLRPTAGTAIVGGERVPRGREQLSLLLQESMVFDRLTGRENARFYEKLHPYSTGRWRTIARELGLADHLDRPVREYSGGMRRKLELAVALDPDVPLYLLDEPTAGLDLGTVRSFHDLLSQERDRGKAVLVGSHVPLDMEIADAVVFLLDGAVTLEGVPGELLRSLPDVLRLRGDVGRLPADVTDCFVEGALFERGDEARGFLREDVSAGTVTRMVEAGTGEVDVQAEPPSYVDLFNYVTMGAGRTDGGS